jgi:hypothetical protein
MPLYFNAVQRDCIIPAATKAAFGQNRLALLPPHVSVLVKCGRHAARLQKDLMRHSEISMTMQYGTGVADVMREFNSQVVKRVIQ